MERNSLVLLIVAVLLLLSLPSIVEHFFPPKPVTIKSHPATNTATTIVSNATPGSNETVSAPSPTSPQNVAPTNAPAGPEETLSVTNEDLIFQFTSRGGGLKTVELRKYPALINRTGKTDLRANMATLNARASVPVLALIDNGAQGDGDFHLTQNGRIVTAEKTLASGLRLTKEFDVGSNYVFSARVALQNTSSHPLTIPERELVIGTASTIGPLDDPTVIGAFWYDGNKAQNIKQNWFANRTLGCIPGTPRTIYQEGANNVIWAAVHNQFFALAAIPSNPAPQIEIHPVYVPAPLIGEYTNSTVSRLTNGLQTTYWYPAQALAPGQTLQHDYTFYAGPKEYKVLSRIGESMNNRLDLIMDFSGFVGFFSKILLVSLNGLNALGLGYGLSILAITLIIRGVFWPLTRASTRSQKRLAALQPQLKAIAEKYKDDATKKNEKTMQFMKEHKVNPMGSCLPMLIQIPVFYGFYWMLRNAIELRGVPFLWIHDLSQPDTIGYLPFFGGFPINPLPLVMAATQFWQQTLIPPSPGMDPDQQKMMRYFPLLFAFMFYKVSSGLTLYWTLSNLLSILQTKLTRMTDEPAAQALVAAKKKV